MYGEDHECSSAISLLVSDHKHHHTFVKTNFIDKTFVLKISVDIIFLAFVLPFFISGDVLSIHSFWWGALHTTCKIKKNANEFSFLLKTLCLIIIIFASILSISWLLAMVTCFRSFQAVRHY